MAGQVALHILIQLASTVGVIIMFGFILWLLRRKYSRMIGQYRPFGKRVIYATAFIGTPVHEIGHAFWCFVFRMKITKIKFFQMNDQDGVLGYVQYKYRKKRLSHRIGKFFVATGPMTIGTIVILLWFLILVPHLLFDMYRLVTNLDSESAFFYNLWLVISGAFTIMFGGGNVSRWQWWLFIIPATMVAIHMSLSWADIKSAKKGLFWLVLLWVVIVIVTAFISTAAVFAITDVTLIIAMFLITLFVIPSLMSLMLVACVFLFKKKKKLIRAAINNASGNTKNEPIT